MNALGLLTTSFLPSLIAGWMIGTRQKPGRMGLYAIALFLLACIGIYAGVVFILPSFGQVPGWLWDTYCVIPLYFVGIALYWLWSLWATWNNWALLWSTTTLWVQSGQSRQEAVKHITQTLHLQGCVMPEWCINFIWDRLAKEDRQVVPRLHQ